MKTPSLSVPLEPPAARERGASPGWRASQNDTRLLSHEVLRLVQPPTILAEPWLDWFPDACFLVFFWVGSGDAIDTRDLLCESSKPHERRSVVPCRRLVTQMLHDMKMSANRPGARSPRILACLCWGGGMASAVAFDIFFVKNRCGRTRLLKLGPRAASGKYGGVLPVDQSGTE